MFDSNTVISGTSHFTVSSSESVAQSFVATASYRLTNVTLRLRNTGDITDSLGVTVRPDADGTPAGSVIPAVFEAVYTNSGDTVVGYVRSNTATVTVVAALTPVLWIGLGSAVAGFLAVLLLHRRFRVTIEDAFLVYRDGVLVYHLSRSLSQGKDEDVLSGMLTAIQAFVRDAFVYGEHRELHHLDFGDYRILIERGRNVYLAVVYSGKGSSRIRKRVRSVLDQVETAYGSVLQNWDGDMDKVIGARDLIREYLLKTNRPRFIGSFSSS